MTEIKEKSNMKKNILWNTFGSVFYSGCQWVITVIIVHMATFEDAGFLSLAMTTSSSFSAISLFSMRNYQVSDVRGKYQTKHYLGSRIVTCLIAFVTCAIYSGITNSWYQALCIDAFMLIRVAEATTDVLHGENQKFEKYDYIGKSYILRGIATIVFFVGGLGFSKDLLVSLLVIAIANLVIAFTYDAIHTGKLENIKPEIISSKVFNLLKECLPIVVFTFLLSLENLIPKQVLQQLNGTDELGIYSTIASPTLVVQVFASVAFNPFLPGMSKLYVDGDYKAFRKLLHKVFLAFVGMCVVVTLGAALLGKPGLWLLFGEDILKYYELFMPIVWCTILTAIIWIMSAIMVAMRKIGWMLVGMIIDFGLCLLVVNPFVAEFGKNGVSFTQILVYGIYILFMITVCEMTVLRKMKREDK